MPSKIFEKIAKMIVSAPNAREMYADGKTVTEIADHFGVHRTTISKHLKKNGVKIKNGRPIKVKL